MSEKIYKKDLVNKLSEKFEIRKSDADQIVDYLFDEICDELVDGKWVVITNFASFKVKESKVSDRKHLNCTVAANLKKRIQD